jgi:hypothetical protein
MFSDIIDSVSRTFRLEAERRKLFFEVEVDPRLPRRIVTDSKRLLQVLKNLLSNAFKFTAHGGVTLKVAQADSWTGDHPVLKSAGTVVSFEVTDSGIGIPAEKQKLIFEAFQQADSGTSRKYGGTGLGLAISRELAGLLGGEITLKSVPDAGSTFTLYLPLSYVGSLEPARDPISWDPASAQAARRRSPFPIVRRMDPAVTVVPDDRADIQPNDAVILIVEDDPSYARVIADLARSNGFKILVTGTGADALDLVDSIDRPQSPRRVPARHARLDRAKPPEARLGDSTHPGTDRTIEEDRQHGLARGAFAFVGKPTTADGLNNALSRIKAFTANGASACCRRRQQGSPGKHHGIARIRRYRHHRRRYGNRGAGGVARAAL